MGWMFTLRHYPRMKLIDSSDLDADVCVRVQNKYATAAFPLTPHPVDTSPSSLLPLALFFQPCAARFGATPWVGFSLVAVSHSQPFSLLLSLTHISFPIFLSLSLLPFPSLSGAQLF